MPDNVAKAKRETHSAERVGLRDALAASSATLNGAADALRFRAEAEDDDMLFLIADVIDSQVKALRKLA